MFTGIIQAIGVIEAIEPQDKDMRMVFSCGDLDMAGLDKGDSIAVNGVCLTVTDINDGKISADVSGETLTCTAFSDIRRGHHINLEKALLPATPLSGHFVSGHVDGVGVINDMTDDGRSVRMRIAVPQDLGKYIATKGSVCVDGVSLTVNHIVGVEFDVNIIPHTRTATIFGEYTTGRRVNIEVDIIARYLERLLDARQEQQKPVSNITETFLIEHGYINKPQTN